MDLSEYSLLKGIVGSILNRGDRPVLFGPFTENRMDDLHNKVESFTNSIPALKVSSEIGLLLFPRIMTWSIVSKIGPILFRQQLSIVQTEAKVLHLLSLKSVLK
jgi:hypothetical protein